MASPMSHIQTWIQNSIRNKITNRPRFAIAFALLLAVVALAVTGVTHAQFGGSRYTSPPTNTEATIGGKKITVDYYAPSMHGRKIMGSLVPFDEVWCTGANWATKITTAGNLQIGALKLAAGSYTIWTLPKRDEWQLIINKQTGQFHLDYDESRDLGRTKMNVKTLAEPVETLKIEVRPDPASANKGTLAVLWEKTEASIPFTVVP